MMDGTGVFRKLVFLAVIISASVAGWKHIQSEEETPTKQPAEKGPTKEGRPARSSQRTTSKMRAKHRALEHALKQVAEKTRDTSPGTLGKRDALVRDYLRAIAATKGMTRAQFTPDRATTRKWLSTIGVAGSELGDLANRYSKYSGGRRQSSKSYSSYSLSKSRTSRMSDEALYKAFCRELSRQEIFVRGLKPAQARGRTRNASVSRHPNAGR